MKRFDVLVSTMLGIVLIFSLLLLSRIPSTLTRDELSGEWRGSFKRSTIVLQISSDGKCILRVGNDLGDEIDQFTGTCRIDGSKRPYEFSINNIDETLYPLHSLMLPLNKQTIQMTEFSSKWRLRALSFNTDNTMILNKLTN